MPPVPDDREVVLVVRLWVDASRIDAYERFECEAMRLLAQHGGIVERVVRRADGAPSDEPFEVHVLRFANEAAITAWRENPATLARAARRDAVIVRTSVFRGHEHDGYADLGPGAAGDLDQERGGADAGSAASDGVPELSARWTASPERLTTTYEFRSFGDAIAFMGRCREPIDTLDHHPDWSNSHRRVHVSLTTHSAGQVTDLDRRLAARLDHVYAASV